MTTQQRVFIEQLRSRIRYAKVRRSWASARLADSKRDIRNAEHDLKKWLNKFNK